MADSQQILKQIEFWQVGDATATTLFSQFVPINSVARAFVTAVATRPSNGDTKSWIRTVLVKRAGASPAISGSVVDVMTPIADAGASTWDLTFVINGNNVDIRVTGQAAVITAWSVEIKILFMQDHA